MDEQVEVRVVGRHIEVTAEIREMVAKKFSTMNRFFSGLQVIDVCLKYEDRKTHCEVIMAIKSHGDIVIDVARDELVEAIDVAVGKTEHQLRRMKEKMIDHSRDAKRKN